MACLGASSAPLAAPHVRLRGCLSREVAVRSSQPAREPGQGDAGTYNGMVRRRAAWGAARAVGMSILDGLDHRDATRLRASNFASGAANERCLRLGAVHDRACLRRRVLCRGRRSFRDG